MNDRPRLFIPLVLFWLVGWPWLATAQEGAPASPATDFYETVEVNVVNVEVYVTDKEGNPVTGLTADDFEIYEDGEPIEISNFYSGRGPGIGADPVAPAAEAPAVGDAEAAAPSTVAPGPAPEDQQLKLVVFVDNRSLRPATRNRVLEALRGSMFFNLEADDEVMLVSYNGGSLDVRHGLTRDPNSLGAAIEDLAETTPSGVQRQLERMSILRELQQADMEETIEQLTGSSRRGRPGSTYDWSGLLASIRNYAQQEYQEVVRSVDVLNNFVDSLSGLPGRKALIYVSDGLSLRPGEALYHAWYNKYNDQEPGARELGNFANIESEAREFDTSKLIEDLGRRANANRVTFYSILASGGLSQTLTPAERAAFINVGTASAATLGQVWTERLETMEKANFRGSMQIMATATGGLATLETRAIGKALQRLRRDFDSYYSLGYVSPREGDGKDHKIKVKVRDKSLRVRHREGYRSKTGDERMSDRVRSALVFAGEDNPLQIVIDFGDEKRDEKGRFLVPIIVKFPIAKLLLLPQEHFHEGRVAIFVGARDGKGGMSPIQKMPAPIRIPNDKLLTALGQVAGFRVTLMMNPGEHSVVVGVRDELANVESTTLANHTPGEATLAAADGTG